MLCSSCGKRYSCTSLCPEASEYSDQDYRYQRELPIDTVVIDVFPSSESYRAPSAGLTEHSELSEIENTVLLLFYSCGLSRKEIAEKLNRKESGVKTALARAKMKLKKTLFSY